LRERHGVASVQKQFHIFASKLFRYGATDPAAGTCDEISFHCKSGILPDRKAGFQPAVAGKMPARRIRQDA
jgi:hypothetical protein